MTRRTSVARLAGAALAVILGTVPALAEISGVTEKPEVRP